MGVRKIHYKDDFELTVKVIDARGRVLPIADGWDFAVTVTTSRLGAKYKAGRHGGVCTGCHVEPDGSLHVMVDNHNLIPGKVSIDVSFDIPQSLYPDGAQHISVKCDDVVELVYEKSDLPSDLEIELQLPTIKGDPFTFADFTPEQIDDLKRPATEAAADLKRFENEVERNERSRDLAEQSRNKAEDLRVKTEQSRQQAEQTRVDNEAGRVKAEQSRDVSEQRRVDTEIIRSKQETKRETSETGRAAAERSRETSETEREKAERHRAANEESRITGESTRNANEQNRLSAETGRDKAEQNRLANEQSRGAAEVNRETAEKKRQSNEETRVNQEAARDKAEKERADSFADMQSTLNTYSVPADEQLESIEPNIVTEALRKTPQILTPSEQNQVIENLGRPDLKYLIDMSEIIGATYNRSTDRFELNGLTDLTHRDMRIILTYGIINPISYGVGSVDKRGEPPLRTNVLHNDGRDMLRNKCTFDHIFYNQTKLEVAVVGPETSNDENYLCSPVELSAAFTFCINLRRVIGTISLDFFEGAVPGVPFRGCSRLEEIHFHRLKTNLNLQNLPAIRHDCMKELIEHAANTSAITITVHPDIYARLTDTANTEWHPLLTAAAARQITFATV